MSQIKLNWRNIIIAATLPAVMEVIWQLYNTYIPVFLQAGNPAFTDAGATTVGFGLGPALTGFILVFDNIAGLFISPLVGAWSDSLRTRWGRRMPFVLFGVPVAVVAFIIIPLIPMGIKPELNGQTGQLTGLLVPFILSLFVVLIAFAIVRPVADVLMFDITPSKQRTTANGIAGAIAGFFVVLTALGGAALYDVYGPLPFWLAAALTTIVLFLTWAWVKEPEDLASAKELAGETFNLKGIVKFLRDQPQENRNSLIFLLISNLLAYVALAQMQAFLSSYGVFSLGMEESSAAMLVAIPAIAFMIIAIPAGLISNKIGRKNTQIVGLVGFAIGALVIYLFPNATMLNIGLLICGLTWPLSNVVQVAMIVDSAPVETLMGTYTGLRQIAVTLGFIIGPILGGTLVESMDNNYRWVWLIMFVFLILATAAMFPVTKGEAKTGSVSL
ncbi:MAG: MFS transporter [Chloroflexi bacterium]|nr:MFS transporter [Chloroflexota bacterium]MBP8056028.1 MFS transporter [Chloroflexota bacterium]